MDRAEGVRIRQLLKETTIISLEIGKKGQDGLKSLQIKYNHIFAWQLEQMPCFDSKVACHKLDINTYSKLVKQKP